MSITIQKDTGGAVFWVTDLNDIPKPYSVNDYVFTPYNDGTFTLSSKKPVFYPSEVAYKNTLIYKQPYTNIINGDTGLAFTSFASLQTYILTNFFRKAGNASAAAWGSITGTLSAQTDLQAALDAKQSNCIQNTGTALVFTRDAIYGTTVSPETGNITGNVTGATLGATLLIIHNNGTTPTFDNKFKLLSGSGSYVPGTINYIFCTYIDSTHILYSINQSS